MYSGMPPASCRGGLTFNLKPMIWAKEHQEHAVLAFVVDYLNSNLREITREQEMVRNCCLAMTNAYLAAYKKMQ